MTAGVPSGTLLTMKKMVRNISRDIQRHGAANTALKYALKVLGSICGLKILRGVHVEQPDASFLQVPEKYTAGFLSPKQLRDYARDPERTELSTRFLNQAAARGDECYAIRDGENLAAYGWYSSGNTPVGFGDLVLTFSADYVYMYKGFTDADYRGQRLHGIGMTRALQHYVAQGRKGLVSWVEAANFDSLKSCIRMGYSVFGSIYLVRVFGRYYAFSSPGCRRFEFRLERPLVLQRFA
jgi:hypothetical protein